MIRVVKISWEDWVKYCGDKKPVRNDPHGDFVTCLVHYTYSGVESGMDRITDDEAITLRNELLRLYPIPYRDCGPIS